MPDFLGTAEADALFAELREGVDWQEETVRIAGRAIPSPRRVAWVADAGLRYRYSGTEAPPQAWPAGLRALRERLQASCGDRYNGVLLNLYRGGQDSVGWHSDDESQLGRNPVVASVSLGATRRFRLQHKRRKDLRYALDLPHGSLLIMAGPTQHHWRHCVPKTARPVGERINLTFRHIVHR